MVLYRRYAIGLLCLVASSVFAFQFSWWFEESTGFTPPQSDQLVLESDFSTIVNADEGGNTYYGPQNNEYIQGSYDSDDFIFFWTSQGTETNTVGSDNNVVGDNSDGSDGKGLVITLKGSSPPSPAQALTNWTWSTWVYVDAWGGGDGLMTVKDAATTFRMLIDESGGSLRFWLGGSSTSVTLPSTGAWHMYTVSYDYASGDGILYVDDTPVKTNSPAAFVLGNPYLALCRRLAGGYGLQSQYDTIRIWDTTLSDTEITVDLYGEGAPDTRAE